MSYTSLRLMFLVLHTTLNKVYFTFTLLYIKYLLGDSPYTHTASDAVKYGKASRNDVLLIIYKRLS